MTRGTLFGGRPVAADAMVIINFHGLLILDKFLRVWAPGQVVVHPYVRNEAQWSQNGEIPWPALLERAAVREEVLESAGEQLFFQYFGSSLSGAAIHKGEAACLALSLSRQYGLLCDERVVRDEFARRAPGLICLNSWGVVDEAARLGFITENEKDDLRRGLLYT